MLTNLEHCRKIHVTGNAGAGKTTAARELGRRLGLPVFSLDSIVWQSGWIKTPIQQREELERALIAKPQWIIDGVSRQARDAADLVLFLDLPVHLCLLRASARSLRHLRTQRPEFPPGCPEWKIYPRLTRLIWQFPGQAGKEIRSEASQDPRYQTLTNSAALNTLFSSLADELNPASRPGRL